MSIPTPKKVFAAKREKEGAGDPFRDPRHLFCNCLPSLTPPAPAPKALPHPSAGPA